MSLSQSEVARVERLIDIKEGRCQGWSAEITALEERLALLEDMLSKEKIYLNDLKEQLPDENDEHRLTPGEML